MSLNLNKTILAGRLVAAPEVKQTPSGNTVCNIRIAVTRRVSGGDHPESDFFNVTAWNNTAEFIGRYFEKGAAICIVGRIQNRSYTDKDGNKRALTDIIADEAHFVESKATADANAYKDPTTHPYEVAGKPIPATVNLVSPAPSFEQIKADDGLPF
jgi:single-strand DNA-binding protein